MEKLILLNQELLRVLKVNNIELSNLNVLDVGCANMRNYSVALFERSKNYIGIDNDKKQIESAKSRSPHLKKKLFAENVENLSFNDNSFDLVVINDTLAYTNIDQALKEVLRVTKKGGIIISLYNNTISYTIIKIWASEKFWVYELTHSVLVILNTILYRLLKIKFFRTTFNSFKSFKKSFKRLGLKRSQIWKGHNIPLRGSRVLNKNNYKNSVINFILFK